MPGWKIPERKACVLTAHGRPALQVKAAQPSCCGLRPSSPGSQHTGPTEGHLCPGKGKMGPSLCKPCHCLIGCVRLLLADCRHSGQRWELWFSPTLVTQFCCVSGWWLGQVRNDCSLPSGLNQTFEFTHGRNLTEPGATHKFPGEIRPWAFHRNT